MNGDGDRTAKGPAAVARAGLRLSAWQPCAPGRLRATRPGTASPIPGPGPSDGHTHREKRFR
eukprot:109831-Hanusia_phi.AAC.1